MYRTVENKKRLVIMDEVDGMSSGDRGGIQELVRYIIVLLWIRLKSLKQLIHQLFVFVMIVIVPKYVH